MDFTKQVHVRAYNILIIEILMKNGYKIFFQLSNTQFKYCNSDHIMHYNNKKDGPDHTSDNKNIMIGPTQHIT